MTSWEDYGDPLMTDRIHSLLIAHSQKVSLAVHALKSSAEAWQQGDIDILEKRVDELGGLEEEADALRRSIARELA
ncbi:MAG TPA: DUF47 family protein, partial [Actinobacteria bacterium]|nr:DUF47 family protein [Actinomycetota bacterium]